MLCKTIVRRRRQAPANRLAEEKAGAATLAPAFSHVAREAVERGKRGGSAAKELERRRQEPGE